MILQNGFGEQALNKILEVALSTQFRKVERMEVQSKIDLSNLAHGEVDFISINVNRLLTQQDLVLEKLKLEINRVIVEPLSALFGKIKLVQPATGTVYIVIHEDDLTRTCNTESFRLHQRQNFMRGSLAIQAQQVMLADNSIVLKSQLIIDGTQKQVVLTATPKIATNRQGIVLENLQYESQEISPELAALLSTQLTEVLSLRSFEQIGMLMQVQQLDVTAGKLVMQGTVQINQFPST